MNWRIVTVFISLLIGMVCLLLFGKENLSCCVIWCFMFLLSSILLYGFIQPCVKCYFDMLLKKKDYEIKITYERDMMELNNKYKENLSIKQLNDRIEKLEKFNENLK